MLIRPEAPVDAAAIGELTTDAFKTAPHASGAEARIVDGLRSAGALTVSLVAVEQGTVVGHVACSPVTINPARPGWYGLGPVSVRPDRQRSGIGRALIRAALEQLRVQGAAGCVLLGDPAYYRRLGFESDPALTYKGRQTRYFQRLLLNGPPAAGDVVFHPAFEE